MTFPNGVFFVNLAPIADPGLVLPTIAQTLAVRERAGETLDETLADLSAGAAAPAAAGQLRAGSGRVRLPCPRYSTRRRA